MDKKESASDKQKIGLIIDSETLPFWAYRMVEKIKDSECAGINLIIKLPCSQKNKFKFLLYQLYEKIENKLFKPQPDASAPKSTESLFSDISVIEYDKPNNQDALKKIRKFKLDVLINGTEQIFFEDIVNTAELGIWSYIHGDINSKRIGPAGFFEVFEGEPEIMSTLLMQQKHEYRILYTSFSLSDHISRNRCNNPSFLKGSAFVIRVLKQLKKLGKDGFLQQIENKNPDLVNITDKKLSPPSNFLFIFLSLRLFFRFCFSYLERRFYNMEQWCLMFAQRKENFKHLPLKDFKIITPPKDRFWADPFVVYKDKQYFIFLEECLFSDPANAYLCVIKLEDDGSFSTPQKILHKSYHLSYPFVFEYEKEFYMIPESGQNKTVELYKCRNFPDKWDFVMNLMENVSAYDSTLFFKDNRWWLFCNIKEEKGAPSFDELFLFSAKDFMTQEWSAHPMNPIVSDVKNARPAGKIFEYEGEIYRPAQNSSHCYGYGLMINRIDTLTAQKYHETTIKSIKPDWNKNALACHTLNYEENFTLMDAVIKRKK